VPLDLYGAIRSGPGSGHRGSTLGASGTAKPRACPNAAKWERGVIAGLAVTGQVRSLPGDGRPGPRHPAARTSFAMS
jgi:hypothetical protein